VTLAQHPEQLAEMRADPAKWAPLFVEELCRYHTASAMAIKRTAKVDVEIGGKVIHCKILDSNDDPLTWVTAAHQGPRGHHRLEPVGQP
jgi:nitric oxide reductase